MKNYVPQSWQDIHFGGQTLKYEGHFKGVPVYSHPSVKPGILYTINNNFEIEGDNHVRIRRTSTNSRGANSKPHPSVNESTSQPQVEVLSKQGNDREIRERYDKIKEEHKEAKDRLMAMHRGRELDATRKEINAEKKEVEHGLSVNLAQIYRNGDNELEIEDKTLKFKAKFSVSANQLSLF